MDAAPAICCSDTIVMMRTCLLLAVLIWGSCCVGCGPHAVSVSGTVTLDGEPLNEAVIMFVPLEAERQKTGADIKEGRYQIAASDGLMPGNYRVEVADNPPLDGPRGANGRPTGMQQRRPFPYRYAHDSLLTAEIDETGEPVVLDFALTREPAKQK